MLLQILLPSLIDRLVTAVLTEQLSKLNAPATNITFTNKQVGNSCIDRAAVRLTALTNIITFTDRQVGISFIDRAG